MKLRYTLRQMTNKAFQSYGKYFADLVHTGVIDRKYLIDHATPNCSAKASDFLLTMTEFGEGLIEYLKQGHIVEIEGVGRFKLEIISEGVNDPNDFDPRKHIKGVRCRFNPWSDKGKKPMYEDLEFEEWK